MLNLPPLGIIPEDDAISFSLPTDVSKNMVADSAFEMIATNLHEGQEDMFDCVSKYSGFLGNIRRKIKRRV